MAAETFNIDLITVLFSLTALVISVITLIYARKQAMIESFISVTNAFFTPKTRQMRRELRENVLLTELKKVKVDSHTPLEEFPKQKMKEISKEDMGKVWELVSAYNRLGFVLHNYPRLFFFLSLRNKFLEWDAETVIDMWKRVRFYVYQTRIEDPGRQDLGNEFYWLFEQASKYQKRKNERRNVS